MVDADHAVLIAAQCALAIVALLIFFFTLRVMTVYKAVHGNCKYEFDYSFVCFDKEVRDQ